MKQYYFTEEHELFRSSLKEFLAKEVAPNINQWEKDRRLPRDIFKKVGDMGYFGLLFPEKYGGLDLDFFYAVIFLEETAKMNSGGFGASIQAHLFLALKHLAAEGTEAQKQKYLVSGINGDLIGCLAISEPDAGSDVAAMRATAIKDGEEYVLNGSKMFITNGVYSDFLIVAAKTNPDDKAKGISLFIVDRDSEGLSASNIEKLGWHASDTGDISFDNVRIPASNLLGEEGQGFLYIMHHFALERLILAIGGIAAADLALEKALQYTSERQAFGRTINKFQVLRHDIAQMASEIEVLRWFNYDLAERFDKGEYIVKEAAMTKLLSTELALKVSDQCLQMFGGYGFTEEYPMARMYRDNMLGPIGGGTSEIMCEIIAKMLIDDKSYASALNGKGVSATGAKYFTEEHELFRQSLRAFLEKEAIPHIDQWEKDGRISRDIWTKMGDMGFLGLSYPEKYGGKGLDFFYDVVFNEELARCWSGGFSITQQVTQYMSSPYILKYASDELKNKYLPKIISGEWIGCIGITEPGAGSDVVNIQTKAIREGDHYIVNGSKTFITNGVYGDFVIGVVKTDPKAGVAGVSLLIIDLKSEGVSARKIDKLGWNASDTAELSFDNVKVPVTNLIGEEGKGFYYLMNGLQLERLATLPAGIVSMERALALTMQYMSERKAFGRPINKFQVLRHRMARMAADVEALKSFTYLCCKVYADNIYDVKLCSIAKLLVAEKVNEVAAKCLHIYGGYGFTEAYPMARFYRDCRVGTIGGGASQIMRNIIAKMIIEGVGYKAAKTSHKLATTKAGNKSKGTNGQASSNGVNPENGTPSLDQLVANIQKQTAEVAPIGNTLKFDFGGQQLFIDGTGERNQVSTNNEAADCTVAIDYNDFKDLLKGQLNPMTAMMTGKLKIEGNMGVAMKLQTLFG